MRHPNRNARWLVLCLTLFLASGCGYGKVSPTTYELAKSLYNISNRKLADRLDMVSEKIESARESGDVSDREAKWLRAIIKQAEKENWKAAMKSARRIMEDQVSR